MGSHLLILELLGTLCVSVKVYKPFLNISPGWAWECVRLCRLSSVGNIMTQQWDLHQNRVLCASEAVPKKMAVEELRFFSKITTGGWRHHCRNSSLSTYKIILGLVVSRLCIRGLAGGDAASTGLNGADGLRTRLKTKALTLGGYPDPRSVTLLVRASVITTLGQPPVITCLGNYFSHTLCEKCHILKSTPLEVCRQC